MSQASTSLTPDELLHLAIEAARRGDHGSAISYLKDGTMRFPEDAKLAYLLGAEYAQISLYDKAEVEIGRSIQLDPNLLTACFQLGLLQLSQGKLIDAKSTWQGLDKLPVDNFLQLFRSGLQYLIEDQYEQAKETLQQGIAVNTFSPDLNRDMQNILMSIPSDSVRAEASLATREHVWLAAYRIDDSDETS